ncbi:putative membrane protein [Clostridium saccharoperbutylacetonicum]|uniref:YibE/F family protein n=1 Tax=Clostridium saccharoperbutylacetonicum N1-4(HMT) TaxID=931276 RepID=M1MHF4_9CLOT|nr:YibE/F family protein [Clostridium saccharoperbutylacetonicum]AGF54356.1 YibE/F family protein [Clostridium saccharoperbutylacetonicum N1-4(HMT)]NRT59127.1 putative membrane protein [Clostridium saccharoperbutylacetonicum]NSB28316.1 putative membrane protein [Clostridium saccharoperbutylacetonicum]NSB41803.1 putative membrane protein [Clostridium saccharoperbutylacetonicum]
MKVNLNWNSSIKICGKIIGPIAVLLIYIVMAVSFSSHTPIYNPYSSGAGGELHYEKGKVVSIDEQVINPSGFSELYIGRQIVNVLIESGQYEGQTFQVNNALNYDTNFVLHKGQDIVVSINTSTGDKSLVNVYMFAPSRVVPLLVLIGIFIGVMCLVGGWRGFHSILGIVFTLTTVLFIFIPLLFHGVSVVFATILLVIITSCVTLFLVGGFDRKSISAILGTVAGVIVSVIIMLIFSKLLGISGYTSTDADAMLNIASQTKLQVKDLLFTGIIIASLGAVMDIAISIATSINELKKQKEDATFKELFSSGMNIGRDMMGTMSNTLILAFLGESIFSFILMYSYQVQFRQLFNSNSIAIDILNAICGSLAVVLTVPIVAAIAAKLLQGSQSSYKAQDGELAENKEMTSTLKNGYALEMSRK